MQIYADVCNRPMKISRSAQTCALGAAIFGAVAAGAYKTIKMAQDAMTGVKETVYEPIPEHVATYKRLYDIYQRLHDGFGAVQDNVRLGSIMKELIEIRNEVRLGN